MMRVGFIGLGSQGGPMARRIVEAGYEVTLWARRKESLEPYADTAAKYADTPAQLAKASDLVCLCVVSDDDVRAVITGENGILEGLRDGGIIAIHSTIHPDTCKELAEVAREKGVSIIDAPVSGGGMGAAAGTLLVMLGGDDHTVEAARPVFETYGNPVVHLGDLAPGRSRSCSTTCSSPPTCRLRRAPSNSVSRSASTPPSSVRSSRTARRTALRWAVSSLPAASSGSQVTPVSYCARTSRSSRALPPAWEPRPGFL